MVASGPAVLPSGTASGAWDPCLQLALITPRGDGVRSKRITESLHSLSDMKPIIKDMTGIWLRPEGCHRHVTAIKSDLDYNIINFQEADTSGGSITMEAMWSSCHWSVAQARLWEDYKLIG